MHTNKLIHESSPYLLQHAHNPVDWFPYGDEAFNLSQQQNKPILISIGYSSCHWCHVMEHESFENEEIAEFMNAHFLCIKVDREEHPDVDHAYMDAIQQIHSSGGWPLNCFALPDGRPFWGGTYFRPDQWMQLLKDVDILFKSQNADLKAQAEDIAQRVKRNNYTIQSVDTENQIPDFSNLITSLVTHFDKENGGLIGAPKFPMPPLLDFIFQLANSKNNKELFDWLELSLNKMGKGGIFDQAGGGFARYSVDKSWKVPHFEKMLYDNAQLISVYARAYQLKKNDFYKEIAELTLEFTERELLSDIGMYYSALDADSEGEEGLFYTWTRQQFEEATGHYANLAIEYFGIDAEGLWENDRNILLRAENDVLFAQQHFLSLEELKSLITYCRKHLLISRSNRNRPALDDKVLAGWNALMIEALCNSYVAFENPGYLQKAVTLANHLLHHMQSSEGILFRTYKHGKAKIHAFLDDYAFITKALLEIYTLTADENWLAECEKFVQYIISNFYDSDSGFFWFSSKTDTRVFARKIETYDGVVPSSNAVMAEVLFNIGKILDNATYIEISENMVNSMAQKISTHTAAYSAWARISLMRSQVKYMITVSGRNSSHVIAQLLRSNMSNAIVCGSVKPSTLPYLKDRFIEGKTFIYVCANDYCKAPVENISEALELLKS